jgi:sporulation protein YlmC with PRC-barrel domain
VHVARELLDKQIVDRDGTRLGRVDALVAELRAGRPPRIVQFELGFVPLARRIHRRLEALAEACHRRWSVRRSARYHIDWTRVIEIDAHQVVVDVKADETVALDWERWLRRHVIGRIPGASQKR